MNLDLYTDEFRDFKFLKCNAWQVEYYKKTAAQLNKIQPWAQTNDPNFVWPHRLEFLEQLFDLRNDTLYIVEPGTLYNTHKDRYSYDFEQARLSEIVNPVVFKGHPMMPGEGWIAQPEDIPEIEDSTENHDWYICSKEYFIADPDNHRDDRVFKFFENSLVPSDYPSYMALFYNRETAVKYQEAITSFLRKNNDSISAISRLL